MWDEHKLVAAAPPCLILAYPDEMYEAKVARRFRRMGWDVYIARSGPEVRRLVPMLEADVVIMDADLPEESGWLTCDKLMREHPQVKVILIGTPYPRHRALAAFVGASALVGRSAELALLAASLCLTRANRTAGSCQRVGAG